MKREDTKMTITKERLARMTSGLTEYEKAVIQKEIDTGKIKLVNFTNSKPLTLDQERRNEIRTERRHCNRYEM